MGFLHPLLLAGLAAVTIPVLIHLLLRQRPKPRPWAAMQWLLAAAQQASRRYRLTNLLLLLLRILIVALLAVAVSRPLLGGLGGGDRLVLIVDRTASMGARGTDPGPLAAASASLAKAELAYRQVTLITVDAGVERVAEGSAVHISEALARLTPTLLPGGLDRAARAPLLDLLLSAVGGGRPDVLLISDFQQDRGDALVAALTSTTSTVTRWVPTAPAASGANAAIVGTGPAVDLLPGQSGDLALLVSGSATAVAVGADEAPVLAVAAVGLEANPDPAGLRAVTVPVPPLPLGDHLLHVQLSDNGLAYDNLLELPIRVRPAVPALIVGGTAVDYLAAALRSDERTVAARGVRPALIGEEALAPGSLVALRAALPSAGEATRLATWVRDGGVLWAGVGTILADPGLAPLAGSLQLQGLRPGGAWNTGAPADRDLDALLRLADRPQVPAVILPPTAEIVLRAGEAPAVVALPVGRGWLILELAELAEDRAWQARGATPLWTLRMARRYTARATTVPQWVAGEAAPEATTLRRGSTAIAVAVGEPLALAPGAWTTAEGRRIVVLPNRDEGRIDRPREAGLTSDLAAALSHPGTTDLGPWLAAVALLAVLGEGLVAAWAGRAYGR